MDMTKLSPILVFNINGALRRHRARSHWNAQRAPRARGSPALGLDVARPLVGAGARALVDCGFAVTGASPTNERVEQLVVDFLEHYEAHIADHTRFFPGAKASLERFQRAGFRLAVCTNKPERLARLLLERLEEAERFDVICGRETFAISKPDGRVLHETIRLARGDPKRAVMVGDSKTDIDTARNAGMPVVAVDFGYSDPPVGRLSPDKVISHFDQLWDAAIALLN